MKEMKRVEEAISLLGWLKRLPEFSRTQFVVFDWLISEVRRLSTLPPDSEKVVSQALAVVTDNTWDGSDGTTGITPEGVSVIREAISLIPPALARVKELESQLSAAQDVATEAEMEIHCDGGLKARVKELEAALKEGK